MARRYSYSNIPARDGRVGGLTEEFEELAVAVGEDPLQVGGDQEAVDERAARDGVAHAVAHHGALLAFFEQVLVHPGAVGPAALHVHEALRGFPQGNLALPAQGDAVELEAVVQPGPRPHLDGRRGENAEAQPGRSEGFQVGGVSEEGEDLLAGPGQPELGFEGISFQRAPT